MPRGNGRAGRFCRGRPFAPVGNRRHRYPVTHSLLIIGQGLAGTALAWRLLERGVSFVIVDRGESGTCSEVAAGLMTPITGMRLNLSWRYPELHPEAVAFYMGLEQRLGTRFHYPMKAVRLLRDEKMRRLWQDTRRHEPDVARYVSADMPGVDEAVLHNPFGGFEQSEAAYVDTQAYLAASRAEFQRLGRWQQAEVTPEALTLHGDGTLERGLEQRKGLPVDRSARPEHGRRIVEPGVEQRPRHRIGHPGVERERLENVPADVTRPQRAVDEDVSGHDRTSGGTSRTARRTTYRRCTESACTPRV